MLISLLIMVGVAVFLYAVIRNQLTSSFSTRIADEVYDNYYKHSDKIRARLKKIDLNSPGAMEELNKISALQKEMENKMDVARETMDKVSYDDLFLSFRRFNSFYTAEDKAKMFWRLEI